MYHRNYTNKTMPVGYLKTEGLSMAHYSSANRGSSSKNKSGSSNNCPSGYRKDQVIADARNGQCVSYTDAPPQVETLDHFNWRRPINVEPGSTNWAFLGPGIAAFPVAAGIAGLGTYFWYSGSICNKFMGFLIVMVVLLIAGGITLVAFANYYASQETAENRDIAYAEHARHLPPEFEHYAWVPTIPVDASTNGGDNKI
jgi:hypothetical protein